MTTQTFSCRNNCFPRLVTLLTVLLCCLNIARLAQASESSLAGERRRRTPIRQRGFAGEFVARPGATFVRGGVLPAARLSVMAGGAINRRFKFGIAPTLTTYGQAKRKPSGGLDVVAAVYPWWGLYARGGFGLTLGLPEAIYTKESEGGFGGLVGMGWEFHLDRSGGENGSLGFGVDYDIRRITRGPVRHSLFFGVNFSW
ncbi:MAG: hypothetical protein ACPG4T_15670 [Nannocystaceae bacterium]